MAIEVKQYNLPTRLSEGVSGLSLASGFNVKNSLGDRSNIEIILFSFPELIIEDVIPNSKRYEIKTNQLSSNNNEEIFDISIDPLSDFNHYFSIGESSQYVMEYNFYDNVIGSPLQKLYISEISSDRTEIKLSSFDLDAISLIIDVEDFIQQREDATYFLEFHLNFGDNIIVTGINIQLNTDDPTNPSALIKLKTPLPPVFDVNDTLWIITYIEESRSYQITSTPEPVTFSDSSPLRSPNFNIDLKSQVNNSTLPLSYTDLITSPQTSSLDQLKSLLAEKSININIDYTNFSNFIHFSSAQTRLKNFQSKIELIDSYSSSISILNNTSLSTNMSSSKASFEGKISNIINNFDGYERFLYYDSGSFSYPKTTNQLPYILAKSNSTEVINWLGNSNNNLSSYGGIYTSASEYDITNRNQLLRSIPEYLRDDPSNQQYELFVDMVAQHYDNIWIYVKDITNKYNNDNRLNFGISKDLVADAIRDFGIKLYQNNFSNNDLFTAFLGLTPDGGLFPYPNMTGSLPTPSGFEYVDLLISASNDILPQEDVNKSLYKRIYHNLPYLLNSKGTIPGLRALITSYGIPDTILRINEYGGKDKVDVNDWDHWQNEFNYAFHTSGNNFISSSWELDSTWNAQDNVPETLMFRFKTDGLPITGSDHHSQSLWLGDGTYDTSITLRYTGSGYTSGSYSGSIKDPYYQYATLNFFPDISSGATSASISLPFFDGNWWSVMLTRQDNGSNSTYTLHAGNKLYEGGNNNTRIGFYGTSSIDASENAWTSIVTSYFPVSFSIASPWGYDIVTYDNTAIYNGTSGGTSSYSPFSGSYQEIRYYATRISESVFKDYIMNPYSIEGNSINSSPDDLAFRAPIGGELYTGSVSIHPKVTGSWVTTQSFATGSSNFYYDSTPLYINNKEFFFVDQPIAGIKNVIGDKIRIENNVFPGGYPTSSVLSPYQSLLQQTNISQSYTPNINYLEVAFSPQNQINEDIMSQIGFFNIGDYIGDPRLRSSSAESYPDLDKLRDDYFKKYIKNYDLKDFIRLIKFFDNSLFKMIKDFIPARTSLASGLVIKQHLLERNKYPQPQVNDKTTIAKYPISGYDPSVDPPIIYNQPLKQQNILISGSVLPQSRGFNQGTIVNIKGGTGGTFDQFNNLNTSPYGVSGSGPTNRYFLTQSWSESIDVASSGSVGRIINNQDEFYDGEFSGSKITVTTQSLADAYPIVLTDLQYDTIVYKNLYYNQAADSNFTSNQFLATETSPCPGEALFLAPNAFTVFSPSFPKGTTIFSDSYIKIHHDDCGGGNNSIPLKQATKIRFQHVGSATYTVYDIHSVTNKSTYCLYRLKGQPISTTGTGITSTVENYFVTASKNAFTLDLEDLSPVIISSYNSFTSASSHCGYAFNNGRIDFNNTPNITLHFTASFAVSSSKSTLGESKTVKLRRQRNITTTTVAQGSYSTGNPSAVTTSSFSASLYPLKGDRYFIEVSFGKSNPAAITTFSSLQFHVTQSVNVVAPQCVDTFVEPYITLPNYYNSNFNPTINNIMDSRLNTIYQDVDYSSGINLPVNFNFLISGSAEKFPIPDSHYTQKSSIIPRYLGAKSTSQKLNTWSPPDTIPGYSDAGTYGKAATVEELKTKIVYADWIGGYPPEHMNASGIHIQYIIDEDGTIKIPNTSENSLVDIQQAFESNDILEISSNTIGTGVATPFRNIIKGGYRIEPILYTQYGHSPALFNVTASFTGDFVSDQSTVNDYQALAKPSASLPRIPFQTGGNGSGLDMNNVVQLGAGASGGWVNNYYKVRQGSIDENVTLNILSNINVGLKGGALGGQTFHVYFNLIHSRGGVETVIDNNSISYYTNSNPNNTAIGSRSLGATLTSTQLQADDRIFVRGRYFTSTPNTGVTGGDIYVNIGATYLQVSQNPIPSGNAISSSGTNTIWGYPNPTLSYAITASNPVLNSFYGKGYRMNNTKGYVTGSGFGTVSLPWELELGDEFRFEGNESSVFMVKKVYNISETDSHRVSQTGSIEVHFDKNISTASINLDNFLIRRCVPDASQILMEGFKPNGSVGPYIIRPEYVTSKLNKGIDDYILDLTNKGLI